MSCLGMDNKKTPADDLEARKARAQEACDTAGLRDKELKTLHGDALRSNVDDFLERRHEFIGFLYWGADYSNWKRHETFTECEWAALTLGLEPNQTNPALGPIPFGPAADRLTQLHPYSQDEIQKRLYSFDLMLQWMESNCTAGKLVPVSIRCFSNQFLKKDLIAWNKDNGLPIPGVASDKRATKTLTRPIEREIEAAFLAIKNLGDRTSNDAVWAALAEKAGQKGTIIKKVTTKKITYLHDDDVEKVMSRSSFNRVMTKLRKKHG